MGDVATGAPRHIGPAKQSLETALALADRLASLPAIFPAVGAGDQLHQVEDVTVFDDDPAIHIGFAQAKARVAGDRDHGRAIRQADRDRLAASRAEAPAAAVRHDERQLPFADDLADQLVNQRHANAPSSAASGWIATQLRGSQ